MCVGGPFLVPTGSTSLPVTLLTTYNGCTPTGEGTAAMPLCLSGDQLPPLPPGAYEANVEWSGAAHLPSAPAVAVTLTP
jgi:hypothetical protein